MSRSRLFFYVYAVLAVLWGVPELYASWVRVSHREVVAAIRLHETSPTDQEIVSAMRNYGHALALRPCDPTLQHDMLLLRGQLADSTIPTGDVVAEDEQLDQVQQLLASILACRPTDGKAWLDYATITLEREGFSKRARAAYAQSAAVTPNESWLAQKRVVMALQLRPLLDDTLRRQVLNDLDILDRANHYRLQTLLKTTGLYAMPKLRALFEGTAEP